MGDEFLKYADDEAYIVRRLGTAFVSLWPEIPEDVREQIVGKSLWLSTRMMPRNWRRRFGTSSLKHAGER